MSCPCGNDACNDIWCFNNWLQCRRCGVADHEDFFLDHFIISCDDESNRDKIICRSCMGGNFFCIKCKRLLVNDKLFGRLDRDSGICKKCLHHYEPFIKLFSELDDEARLELISKAVDNC